MSLSQKTLAYFSLCLVVLLSSCATYHITTQSLVEQFVDVTPEKKNGFVFVFPLYIPFSVEGNSLQQIVVLNKENQPVVLPVDHRTGVRITLKNGKRSTFYFDTLLLKDSTINGKKDHFFGFNAKPIVLSSIDKIEIQK
jgi:hypothetical protein